MKRLQLKVAVILYDYDADLLSLVEQQRGTGIIRCRLLQTWNFGVDEYGEPLCIRERRFSVYSSGHLEMDQTGDPTIE